MDAVPGTFNVTLTGSNATQAANKVVTVTVTEAASYSATVTLNAQSDFPPAAFTVTGVLSVTRQGGHSATITVSNDLGTLPTGTTVTWSPTSVDTQSDGTVCTIQFPASTAAGLYSFTVTTDDGISAQQSYPVVVQVTAAAPTGSFTLQMPSAETAYLGTWLDLPISLVSLGGFEGQVALQVTGIPVGCTYTLDGSLLSPESQVTWLHVFVPANYTSGSFTVGLRGTCSGYQDATATCDVMPLSGMGSDFKLAVASSLQIDTPLSQDRSYPLSVLIERYNCTDAISLAVSGTLPAGVTAEIAPEVATGTSATLLVKVSANTPAFTDFALTVAGTNSKGTVKTVQAQIQVLLRGHAGSYFLTTDKVIYCASQGNPATATVYVVRNAGHTAPVTLSIYGFSGASVSGANPVIGDSTQLQLTALSMMQRGGSVTVTVYGIDSLGEVESCNLVLESASGGLSGQSLQLNMDEIAVEGTVLSAETMKI